jgi:hypothetical protein
MGRARIMIDVNKGNVVSSVENKPDITEDDGDKFGIGSLIMILKL